MNYISSSKTMKINVHFYRGLSKKEREKTQRTKKAQLFMMPDVMLFTVTE